MESSPLPKKRFGKIIVVNYVPFWPELPDHSVSNMKMKRNNPLKYFLQDSGQIAARKCVDRVDRVTSQYHYVISVVVITY